MGKKELLFCECGCGGRVSKFGNKYINRHSGRKRVVEQWVKNMNALLEEIFCACGCGGRIEIKSSHRYDGIPKYTRGHSWRGKKRGAMSEEQRESIRKGLEGKSKSKEHRKKIGEGNKGKHDHHGSNNPMYGKGYKVRREDNPNWRGGISKLPYSFEFDEEFKTLIRERDNYTCQLCGKTKEQEGRNLCVHHIGYDKENDCSDEDDFTTLCSGCNGKANGDREYWTKFFQKKLRLVRTHR